MITAEIIARKADEDDVNWEHDGDCKSDQIARTVCEGIYLDRLNDNLELCAALRAVYAIAGEDPQVRKIVEDALNEYAA